jgi:hypothetical protein
MLNNTDMAIRYSHDRCNDYLAAAEHDRLVRACGRPLAFTRRAARPLGRALLSLSAWLLRYGKDETATTMRFHRPSSRSIKLN